MEILLVALGVVVVLWLAARAFGGAPRRAKTQRAMRDAPAARSVVVNYLKPGPDDVPLMPREAFVAGINKMGLCGRHRQDVIADCCAGDEIILIRQPDNPHDKEAIVLVRAATAEDIGFLPAATADEVAPRLDKGSPVTARYDCTEPFETEDGKRLLGARIMLTPHRLRRKSEAPQEMQHMPYVSGTYRTPEGE
jgi:hypothetical protein